MTQKELSYVEDAVEHETNIIKILEDTKNNLTDENLITFITNAITTHSNLKEKLMNMLEAKANGE